MGLETFALINNNDQVVNHIVIDKDDVNFESNMAAQLIHWGCVRSVETNSQTDIIILDESPEIWTTHTEETGFVTPFDNDEPIEFVPNPTPEVSINGRAYPVDSLLIKENSSLRPLGWVFPVDEVEVSLNDAD